MLSIKFMEDDQIPSLPLHNPEDWRKGSQQFLLSKRRHSFLQIPSPASLAQHWFLLDTWAWNENNVFDHSL